MKEIKNESEENTDNKEYKKELMESLRNIKLFNEKMILSTSMKNKEIYLWSENSGTIAFTYLDENLRTYIPYSKINIIDPKLYSEYFIYLHENKSLFNIWRTSDTQYYSKFSCTDEKISCFCISNDSQILYIGTYNGYIISYNLNIGKILRNIQITKNEIIKLEQIENILIALTNDKILIYNFNSFLDNENNNNIPKDILSYNFKSNFISDINNDNNNKNFAYKNFVIEYNKYIYLFNEENILILNIEDLKPYKLFHIIGENEEYKKIVKIDKLLIKEGIIYFNNGLKDIFSFNTELYKSENTFEIKINKNNSMLYLPNTVKFSLGNISIFILGTKDNIITGHEDGKICFWKKKTINSIFYNYENMNQIHKGMVTNIILLNKPISQYGLNFNKQISECIINKTQIKNIDKIKIKQNNNYIENFIDDNIQNNMDDILLDFINNDNDRNSEKDMNVDDDSNSENQTKTKNKSNKKKKNKNK